MLFRSGMLFHPPPSLRTTFQGSDMAPTVKRLRCPGWVSACSLRAAPQLACADPSRRLMQLRIVLVKNPVPMQSVGGLGTLTDFFLAAQSRRID